MEDVLNFFRNLCCFYHDIEEDVVYSYAYEKNAHENNAHENKSAHIMRSCYDNEAPKFATAFLPRPIDNNGNPI
jgi:hypothetical protein